MASLSSSSSSSKSTRWIVKTLLHNLLAFLIIFSSSGRAAAACTSQKIAMERFHETYGHVQLHLQLDHVTGFRHRGMVFNFLPKGTAVPPSDPSKRHNMIPMPKMKPGQ
ncbi:hypothetical protein SAY87_001636 [Trapa incisa]|uniref:Uncharacterized protein n=1 Tax=Trapa incisa TaxID=236973 RepID=A0AAN7JUH1_9MYRT|nr:hypothetical protein SAY87_001636 [Trapa incisa]